jgi:glycosyltransferase involved in cell wall biosynthesis
MASLRTALAKGGFRVVHTVSSLQVGGMEHLVLRVASEQLRRGYRVGVLALRAGPLMEQARRLGVPVRVANGSFKVSRGLRAIGHLARWRPEIVHVHNPTSLHYGMLSKLVSTARIVVTMHGERANTSRTATALEWRHVEAVAVVSHAASATLRIPDLQNKLQVIHNGVSLAETPSGRDRIRSVLNLDHRFTGIIVGRIDGQKGHDVLVESIALLRRAAVDITVLVVGDGAQRCGIEERAHALGLESKAVQFLGMRSDVPDLLAAADFFVLPSKTEGLPLAVLEAMAHGLPIIATPVGGLSELITHGDSGLHVAVDAPQELASAMTTLHADRELCRRLGTSARRRALNEFSFDSMIASYEQLYIDVCARTRCS